MSKNLQEEKTDEQKKAEQVVEEIAIAIAKLSRQVTALLEGRVKKQTIIILLTHMTKLSKWQVEKVLDAIVSMEKVHLNR